MKNDIENKTQAENTNKTEKTDTKKEIKKTLPKRAFEIKLEVSKIEDVLKKNPNNADKILNSTRDLVFKTLTFYDQKSFYKHIENKINNINKKDISDTEKADRIIELNDLKLEYAEKYEEKITELEKKTKHYINLMPSCHNFRNPKKRGLADIMDEFIKDGVISKKGKYGGYIPSKDLINSGISVAEELISAFNRQTKKINEYRNYERLAKKDKLTKTNDGFLFEDTNMLKNKKGVYFNANKIVFFADIEGDQIIVNKVLSLKGRPSFHRGQRTPIKHGNMKTKLIASKIEEYYKKEEEIKEEKKKKEQEQAKKAA